MNTHNTQMVELEESDLANVTGGESILWIGNTGWCDDEGCAAGVWWPEGSDGGP